MQTGDDARGGRIDLGSAKYALGRRLREIVSCAPTWEDAAEQAAAIFTPPADPPAPGPSVEEMVDSDVLASKLSLFGAANRAWQEYETAGDEEGTTRAERHANSLKEEILSAYDRMTAIISRLAVTKIDAEAAPVTVSDAAEGKSTTDASRDKDDLPNRSEATWRALNVAAIEAEALLARLDELDGDALTAAGVRDYYRHVDPVAARLRQALFDAAVDGTGSAAALAGTPAGDGWRDISTAPRDGADVLLWMSFYGGRCERGVWNDDRHAVKPRPYWRAWAHDISTSRSGQPTHWRPLPAPPGPEQEG